MQSWATEMEESNREKFQAAQEAAQDELYRVAASFLDELEGIAAIDFVNAYGYFFRSSALAEIIEYAPCLVGMFKSQWQNISTVYWQRVDGHWTSQRTSRGGFQAVC